ncbi:maltotransferase domain-containing protein, partial [Muriicola sp.]|uniref:maltotransferase domain-containing protein n=1 Tax=Muriicola sp. TaxID=2020856 RepID=UPI003563FEC8
MPMKQERVVIENVNPQLQCGTYFIKRVVGEKVIVHADVLGDGHDVIQAEVAFKHEAAKSFTYVRMDHLGNDVYKAEFKVDKQGFYEYKVQGWVDNPLNWQHGIEAKLKDGQTVISELLDGIQYLEILLKQLKGKEKEYILELIRAFQDKASYDQAIKAAVSVKLHSLFVEHPLKNLINSSRALRV